MVTELFGEVPSTFEYCWDMSMPAESSVFMDPPQLIKFLYLTVKPSGIFHPSVYHPNIIATVQEIVSIPIATVQLQPKRIHPVVPSKFIKKKLLGQGGQGIVYLGTYDGQVK